MTNNPPDPLVVSEGKVAIDPALIDACAAAALLIFGTRGIWLSLPVHLKVADVGRAIAKHVLEEAQRQGWGDIQQYEKDRVRKQWMNAFKIPERMEDK